MQCFSRRFRILDKQSFGRVFRQGRRVKSKNKLIRVYFLENTLGYPRLGLALAKKYNSKAVQRNRIKRQLRETFRCCKHQLSAHDIVVMSANAHAFSKQHIAASFIECLDLFNEKIFNITH